MISVKRALISVSSKDGVAAFAAGLAALGVEIISTGGTASLLREHGIRVVPISDLTGFPEIMDGRVKTLTPQVHAGLLARRDKAEHLRQIEELGIGTIDLVAINLYPFEATVRKPGVTFEEAIENIDIGGPAMLRSAAKNFAGVVVVTDPEDYPVVLAQLREQGGRVDETLSYRLARKAFRHTSRYDGLISSWLDEHAPVGMPLPAAEPFPPVTVGLALQRRLELRYGENPHQRAGLYEAPGWVSPGLAQAEVLQGKALSFNNFLDLDSAWAVVLDFDEPAVAIVKHNNPCGAAVGSTPQEAYRKALASDPVSAYGGIVGCNREITPGMVEAIGDLFLEAIVAPAYHPDALVLLNKRKNLRLLRLQTGPGAPGRPLPDLRTISGGLLLQERDTADVLGPDDLKTVTTKKPSPEELKALRFAWTVVRHLKSNAILFAAADRLLSMGAGHTSRVDAVRFAKERSRLPLAGSVLASDAFFPFRDGLDLAADAGAVAVIQPGGSVRDNEVIAAADERGIVMVFTGRRHFKH